MNLDDIDPVIHAPKRLAAMAVLANSDETEFAFLRRHLEALNAIVATAPPAATPTGP